MNRLYKPNWTLLLSKCAVARIACLFIFASISACDGGIFGTGDGDATVIPPNMSGNSPAPVDSVPGTSTDGQSETPSENADSQTSGITFNNSINSTGRSDALIKVVHASSALQDSVVMTLNDEKNNPLIPLPGLDYIKGASSYLSIAPTENTSVELLAAENFRANMFDSSRIVDPLNLVEGSTTTLIVRETLNQLPIDFEILPLITLSSTGNNNASLRIIHAAKSLASGSAIEVILIPSGGTRDQAIAGYAPLDYTNQPESAYVTVPPGQYKIQFSTAGDDIGLTGNNLINLTTGQPVTLVIRDTQTGTPGNDIDILLLEDSLLP